MVTAPVLVPQMARVSFPPTQIRTIFLLCFLLSQNTAFASAMVSFEVVELAEFIERHVVD
jgi:hypothetical protein